MPMSERARKAFDALQALGVPVHEWGEGDGYSKGTAFVFGWRSHDGDEVFADYRGTYIRERFENGKYINPLGYRQDLHEILKKFDLVTDWGEYGQIIVYEDPNAPGLAHRRVDEWVWPRRSAVRDGDA